MVFPSAKLTTFVITGGNHVPQTTCEPHYVYAKLGRTVAKREVITEASGSHWNLSKGVGDGVKLRSLQGSSR